MHPFSYIQMYKSFRNQRGDELDLNMKDESGHGDSSLSELFIASKQYLDRSISPLYFQAFVMLLVIK